MGVGGEGLGSSSYFPDDLGGLSLHSASNYISISKDNRDRLSYGF